MKKITLKFYNPTEKKNTSVTINEIKEDLNEETIKAAMKPMIGVLVPENYEIDEAYITDTQKTEIFNKF